MNRVYICLLCNHRHRFLIDAETYDTLTAYFEDCTCGCKKSILNNLELLEYKYEQSVSL